MIRFVAVVDRSSAADVMYTICMQNISVLEGAQQMAKQQIVKLQVGGGLFVCFTCLHVPYSQLGVPLP
jgi:hypothetical protein